MAAALYVTSNRLGWRRRSNESDGTSKDKRADYTMPEGMVSPWRGYLTARGSPIVSVVVATKRHIAHQYVRRLS
jgi:hypothetical protein